MAEHAEVEKWEGDGFGKEDFANGGGNVGKGIADAADHKVLERTRMLNEWGLVFLLGIETFTDELKWQLSDCDSGLVAAKI